MNIPLKSHIIFILVTFVSMNYAMELPGWLRRGPSAAQRAQEQRMAEQRQREQQAAIARLHTQGLTEADIDWLIQNRVDIINPLMNFGGLQGAHPAGFTVLATDITPMGSRLQHEAFFLLMIPSLLEAGHDINWMLRTMTLAHLCLEYNFMRALRLIVSYPEFDPNKFDRDEYEDMTVLMRAVWKNNLQAVRILVARDDIDLSLRSRRHDRQRGQTALEMAQARPNTNPEIIRLLQERARRPVAQQPRIAPVRGPAVVATAGSAGAPIIVPDRSPASPFRAPETPPAGPDWTEAHRRQAPWERQQEQKSTLLPALVGTSVFGAFLALIYNKFYGDSIRQTRLNNLVEAIATQDLSKTNEVLKELDDINVIYYGLTPLMVAAAVGDSGIVDAILAKNPNLDARATAEADKYLEKKPTKREGRTAVIFAAANGHEATVRKLLEHGADVHIRNRNGLSALDYAEKNYAQDKRDEDKSIIDLLKSYGAKPSALAEIMRESVKKG